MNLIKTLITVTLALASAFAFAAVEVNKASQAELETIKGVGPAMSGKIVEARKSGAFKDWPDLVGRVKGIGDANAGKFSGEGLIVNGTAYARVPAMAPRDAGKTGPKKATVEPTRK
ncbi:MAG TPA: helix-hairpin-helix domain-containing protein [Burkholderiaceae bacterium]|nr:helix-hairpin-helix domain-containing protein [Burkholderiaceae bacterium]